jgi:hypothetical protein
MPPEHARREATSSSPAKAFKSCLSAPNYRYHSSDVKSRSGNVGFQASHFAEPTAENLSRAVGDVDLAVADCGQAMLPGIFPAHRA